MAFKLPLDKRAHVQVAYVDKAGNPAVVDGEVEWASSDESIAYVTPDENDSTKCAVTPSMEGNVGQVQISATADADLGDGLDELVTIMDVEVIGGQAVGGTITPVGELEDAPQPKS